jgi:hypothetical protein
MKAERARRFPWSTDESGDAEHRRVKRLRERRQQVVTLPLAPYVWALLQFPRPLTEAEYQQLLHLLGVMKRGLVAASPNSLGSAE